MTVSVEFPTLEAAASSPWRSNPTRTREDLRGPRLHSSESSRALLGLLRLSQTAAIEMGDQESEATFAGVISKGVLRSLLGTLHHRHLLTLRHSRRVALLAFGLANHLGWDGRQLRVLEVAGLLHDIGKIGVPDTVLEKPGRLSPDEIELITLHNNVGFDLLQACRVDRQVQEVISQSQQAYCPDLDSTLQRPGSELHMGARILAVADAYDSLATEQPHRRAKAHLEIMTVLTEGSGTQFDANVVSALARWVQQDGVPFASSDHDNEPGSSGSSPIESHEADSIGQIFSYLHTLERLYDGFTLVDTNGRVLIWNRRAERLLGRPAETMLGAKWSGDLLGYRHLDERNMSAAETPMLRAIETGKTALLPMLARHGNGQSVQVELQAVPIFDDRGCLQGVAEFYRDLARVSGKNSHNVRDLKLAATRDALTNVANRRELENQLSALVEEFAEKSRETFSVIFADADHFKRVNDTYGHSVGDQVLIDLARLLTQETYSGELVGRYGGEEFVILCPDTDLEQAVRRAERLRATLRNAKIGGVDRLRVTASFGVAQAEPGDSIESLLRRADKALYKAKEEGRDRTCSFTLAQLQNSEEPVVKVIQQTEPFVYQSRFTAVVASDMITYKLGGFVNDHQARLTTVTAERVVMTIGSAGFLAALNPFNREIPVEIDLTMHGLSDAVAKRGIPRIQFGVSIRSLRRIMDSAAFQHQACQLMMDLKRYFVAD
jgi:diguanylate cyclase (GGDEF)-like protein/putative nucleotidyltransferase with HDIG domain/PAS domain S-box-containing protein